MNKVQKKQHLAMAAEDLAKKNAFLLTSLPLNCAPGFWGVYRSPNGAARRKKLMELFSTGHNLPVNGKWQASTKDSDLSVLLKKGLITRLRLSNGGKTCRQSYLTLNT